MMTYFSKVCEVVYLDEEEPEATFDSRKKQRADGTRICIPKKLKEYRNGVDGWCERS